MKSRFYRPVCWSVLLFCLACNARAETPSPESKNKQERVAPPSRKESNGNKPVLIGTEPIKGHHEYESEARGDTGLRGSTTSAAERPASFPEGNQPRPQQNYTLPTAKSGPAKSEPVIGVSPVDAEHKESPTATTAEN